MEGEERYFKKKKIHGTEMLIRSQLKKHWTEMTSSSHVLHQWSHRFSQKSVKSMGTKLVFRSKKKMRNRNEHFGPCSICKKK